MANNKNTEETQLSEIKDKIIEELQFSTYTIRVEGGGYECLDLDRAIEIINEHLG